MIGRLKRLISDRPINSPSGATRRHDGRVRRFLLILVCLPLLLTGCFEIRSVITLRADGSGTHESEFVLIKRELSRLGPAAVQELEEKTREDLQAKIKQLPPGKKPPQFNEYVDEQGNRVFNIKEDFRDLNEIDKNTWNCSWTVKDRGFLKKQYGLRCQFTETLGPLKAPVKLQIQMPGTILSTNGQKRSDNEVEWIFKGGWRRGAIVEASAEGSGLPANILPIAAGSALTVLLAGAGYWYLRRRPSTSATRSAASAFEVEGTYPNSAGLNCPACGTGNTSQAKFCRSCGTKLGAVATAAPKKTATAELPIACPNCSAGNPAATKFCRSCGTPLKAVVIPSPVTEALSRPPEVPQPTAFLKAGEPAAVISVPVQEPSVQQVPAAVSRPVPASPPVTVSQPAPIPPGPQVQRESAQPPAARATPMQWMMPAIIAAVIAVVGVGGWFGYSQWANRPTTQAVAPQAPIAQAPQVQPKPAPAQTPAPATAPFTPPVPMARDEANGCYVWKPNLLPSEGVRWSGGCSGSLAHGPGKAEWFADGKSSLVYEGIFKAGMIQGPGKMTAAGGDAYEGEYVDGRRQGRGTYVAASGERYEGQWKANKREGTGTLVYVNGDRYEGDFKDNKRDGNATFTKPDGEKYVGEYREDRREGRGVLVRADGARYEGMFKDGKPLGPMTRPAALAKAPPPPPVQPAPVAPPVVPTAPAQPRSAPQPVAPPPATKAPSPVVRTETRPALPPPPPPPPRPTAPVPAVPPPVATSAPREAAPADRPAPPSQVAQASPSDPCAGLAGLKLEQCRSCRDSDRVRRLLCEEKTRFTYCFGKGSGTADCPQAQPRQEGGS